jgi:hypothetical protein
MKNVYDAYFQGAQQKEQAHGVDQGQYVDRRNEAPERLQISTHKKGVIRSTRDDK